MSGFHKAANTLRRAYWFVFRPKRFGVKVLLVRGGEILLVRHSYDACWNLPGGGFNPRSESAEKAAAREVKEELSLEVECRLLGQYESTLEFKRDTVYCLVAKTEASQVTPSKEIAEFAWFKREELPDRLSTAVTKALAML